MFRRKLLVVICYKTETSIGHQYADIDFKWYITKRQAIRRYLERFDKEQNNQTVITNIQIF